MIVTTEANRIMLKCTHPTALFLLLLFILQNASLVSSVSFSLNIDRSNSERVWKLSSDDYRNLEEGNPGATLKSGTNFPHEPEQDMQIFTFAKLMITKPLSSNVTCDQDFVRWLESVYLDTMMDSWETPNVIPKCVGATLSVVGIHGSCSGIVKTDPISLKYLVGGNATIRMSSSKGNVSRRESGLVNPALISNLSSWTELEVDSNLKKVSVEATVKSDAIMLLLDVMIFDVMDSLLIKGNESDFNDQFDWEPDGLLIRETRNFSSAPKLMEALTVRKQIYPESWDQDGEGSPPPKATTPTSVKSNLTKNGTKSGTATEITPSDDKHVKGHKTSFGLSNKPTTQVVMTPSGQGGPAKPTELLILCAAIISVAFALCSWYFLASMCT